MYIEYLETENFLLTNFVKQMRNLDLSVKSGLLYFFYIWIILYKKTLVKPLIDFYYLVFSLLKLSLFSLTYFKSHCDLFHRHGKLVEVCEKCNLADDLAIAIAANVFAGATEVESFLFHSIYDKKPPETHKKYSLEDQVNIRHNLNPMFKQVYWIVLRNLLS